MASDVVQVKMVFELPEQRCMFRLSKLYPNLIFKNISMLPIADNMGNTLVEVSGSRAQQLLGDMEGEPNVASARIVLDTPEQVIINVHVNEAIVLNLLGETKVIVDYPIVFQDGHGFLTLIGGRGDVDALLTRFEERGIIFTVKSIGGISSKEILSERQKEVLVRSLKAGFFETPRRVSLTELAREFDVSPTALSEMIRRLSKRLAEHYVRGSA
ncbi:MAG: helix-turn-helix domain-containing protein [Candidatus Lokiarchaeota archaeon]|nr:helix-turn-helix domain-containing protein [Candidatus Lokiarchaeota archaeon]